MSDSEKKDPYAKWVRPDGTIPSDVAARLMKRSNIVGRLKKRDEEAKKNGS